MIKTAIIIFQGSNRHHDLASAIFLATGKKPIFIPALETTLPPLDWLFLPGGFSYGDYLRSGAMAAKTPIMRAVKKFADSGGYVFGICNGFQILCETGLLPGVLLKNQHGRFLCDWQGLVFSPPFDGLYDNPTFPIAHGEGRFFASPDVVQALQDKQQILCRYQKNPNGSVDDIAGVCNDKKNIFGMMPHPENAVTDFQQSQDGLGFFQKLMARM